jgi:oxygen-independent coproporphyrinogen-3 oxidase
MSDAPVGLYIHIPFCRAKCPYCDFNSYPHLQHLHQPYARAVCAELERFAQRHGHLHVDTIYLGGGTPTCLAPTLLTQILTTCQSEFEVEPRAEISVEANPGTVTLGNLAALRCAGVNRLSLGAQSLRDDELRLLGRIHSAAEARQAVHLARSASIVNINLDLIYGLPRQSLAAWSSTLEEALALAPDHLSLYALSLEDGTPLAMSIDNKELPEPDPDLAAQMYMTAEELLSKAGYEHYELSNWARPTAVGSRVGYSGSESAPPALCCHNLKYWRRDPYLGFGAGAHSFHRNWRYHNVPQPQEYVSRLEKGQDTVESQEWIGPDEAMAETMILGLRLTKGVRFDHFQQQHRHDMRQQYGAELDELHMLDLLAVDSVGVRLTPRGRLLANQAFVRFWPRPAQRLRANLVE